jgi:hypothetical protein
MRRTPNNKLKNNLTKKDYIKILSYYKKEIPSNFNSLKREAENILSDKLCKCIKKVDRSNESKSIAICSDSIFKKKGFVRGTFKCGKKRTVRFTRKNKK